MPRKLWLVPPADGAVREYVEERRPVFRDRALHLFAWSCQWVEAAWAT